ncbi:MAG: Uncharacterised protein [Rhodospirillaceae bacterium]|nr:MAG: Uncharacterised protein [Rhodospirillaceae bacterium]
MLELRVVDHRPPDGDDDRKTHDELQEPQQRPRHPPQPRAGDNHAQQHQDHQRRQGNQQAPHLGRGDVIEGRRQAVERPPEPRRHDFDCLTLTGLDRPLIDEDQRLALDPLSALTRQPHGDLRPGIIVLGLGHLLDRNVGIGALDRFEVRQLQRCAREHKKSDEGEGPGCQPQHHADAAFTQARHHDKGQRWDQQQRDQ